MKKLFLLALCLSVAPLWAQTDLKKATIAVSSSIPLPMRETAPRMLREEITSRTKLNPGNGFSATTIALVLAGDREVQGRPVPAGPAVDKAEGYRVVSEAGAKGTTIWVIGADARGVLFGAGWLLRHLQMAAGTLTLPGAVDVASAPKYPIRGHQLGYRHTANSYDAWTVRQFEQYIRELAIFGSNAVEGIPFHEEETSSPHFKISPKEMRIRMSALCRDYDMDYWVWTPVTFELTDEAKRKAELALHEEFYKACPRLDHIFVPGGDPGDNHPREVMPFLKDLHDRLVKYHPNAKIWLSLQGFSVEQIDYFYRYLDQNKPAWLEGLAHGPGSPSLSETRYRLPKNYKLRQYPDITHNVRCEFPVERWDQAYALTLGREAANPRPFFVARTHARYAPFTDGFVSYSDGCHDDLNKVVWSMRAWDPEMDVNEILADYTRFFFGPLAEALAAAGLTALEANWSGPLAENGGVEGTLSFWKTLEAAHPALKSNWRWQLYLMRAYYDAYTRRRLVYETGLEKQANDLLAQAGTLGAGKAMDLALAKINQADSAPISPDLRKRIEDLCADLYASIGLQTSVPKHQAKGYERGCVLDFVDYPLNNRWWLSDEFGRIRQWTDPAKQQARLLEIAKWENPGPGSFYDDISSVSKGPRVKTISDDATDIAWWDNGKSRARLSFQTFQRLPELEYDFLDPGAQYRIRVVGSGDALLRVDGKRLEPLVYSKEENGVKEWLIPDVLTRDGQIRVTFDGPEESQLNWRKQSKISDIWLLK